MRRLVSVIIVSVIVLAAATVFLAPSQDWTDIPIDTDVPVIDRSGGGDGGDGGDGTGTGTDGSVTDLGTVSILSSVLFTDGSERVLRRETVFGFVFDPSGKRVANIDFQADYIPNLRTTVLGAGNTVLTMAVIGPLGSWSRTVDGMELRDVPTGQRVTPVTTTWFSDAVAHLPDGGYKMTWTLRLKLSWGAGTAADPLDVRTFTIVFPTLDLSILSEQTGGGDGGGRPRPLMITRIELTPTVREVPG